MFSTCDLLSDSISIHALREEGDEHQQARKCREQISIHALREEGNGYDIEQYGY